MNFPESFSPIGSGVAEIHFLPLEKCRFWSFWAKKRLFLGEKYGQKFF
jgi:hypothetical protein